MFNLQDFVQDNSKLTIQDIINNNEKLIEIEIKTTKFDENNNIIKDKKRIFDIKQKNKIFEKAKQYKQFNKDTMKVDVVGFVVIKHIQVIDIQRKDLSFEYEHIHSHNQGGKTIEENSCLLQSKLNRSKGDISLYKIEPKQLKKLKKNCGGIKGKDLLNGLVNDYDNTCNKFNLTFVKHGKKWEPVILVKTISGKNIYQPYYKHETDFYKKIIDGCTNIRLDHENMEKLMLFYESDDTKTIVNSIPENNKISENENKEDELNINKEITTKIYDNKIKYLDTELDNKINEKLYVIGSILLVSSVLYTGKKIYDVLTKTPQQIRIQEKLDIQIRKQEKFSIQEKLDIQIKKQKLEEELTNEKLTNKKHSSWLDIMSDVALATLLVGALVIGITIEKQIINQIRQSR